MLIWLGKQMLGQQDKQNLEHTGANGGPSGTYADEDPPTTGLGYVYELANDPEGTLNETWIITYNGGVAP